MLNWSRSASQKQENLAKQQETLDIQELTN